MHTQEHDSAQQPDPTQQPDSGPLSPYFTVPNPILSDCDISAWSPDPVAPHLEMGPLGSHNRLATLAQASDVTSGDPLPYPTLEEVSQLSPYFPVAAPTRDNATDTISKMQDHSAHNFAREYDSHDSQGVTRQVRTVDYPSVNTAVKGTLAFPYVPAQPRRPSPATRTAESEPSLPSSCSPK